MMIHEEALMNEREKEGAQRRTERPSEADHDRNTPDKNKGLAESGVNAPHVEKSEQQGTDPGDRSR